MNLIIDANPLIYLCKTNLFQRFMALTTNPIQIDTSVYKEVVEDGIKANYPDAYVAKKYIEDYKIPIIPMDVTNDLIYFRDPGETSCYLLAKQGGICLTTDNQARKKMKQLGIDSLQLDELFFNMGLEKKITINEFELIISKLEKVYATTSSRSIIFVTELKRSLEKNE
jgi:hypothetical protein